MIHLLLKARAHADIFGTRVCRVESAWLGARARAGGRAHVAALERSQAMMYGIAVCMDAGVRAATLLLLVARCLRGYSITQWANP